MRCHWLIVALLFLVPGCIGTSPQDRRYDELISLGANDDGGEEHNPGFPCGDCHGPSYAPGEEVFALAGTTYLLRGDGDDEGLAGVTVHVRDALGREAQAVTNEAGNFMFQVGGEGGDGRASIGFWPEYPIEAWIEQGGVERRMETPIRRARSCATCHFREPSATSVGRVYLMETP